MRLGLDMRARKGNIEATPIISKKAIIINIINKKKACLRSEILNKDSNCLKNCISFFYNQILIKFSSSKILKLYQQDKCATRSYFHLH